MFPQLKKLLLSAAVMILFAMYAFQMRSNSVAIDPNALASAQNQTTAAQAPDRPAPPSPTAPPPIPTITAQPTRQTEQATEPPPAPTTAPTLEPPTAIPTETQDGIYRDGTYNGIEADAHWGTVLVVAQVSNGELSDIQISEYPNHRNRSVEINNRALPKLIQEAIQAQSAEIDLISGATDTSWAFIQSLDAALQQATA